jgi:hypothetical protein
MKLIDEAGNEIASAEILNLQPGDICVLSHPKALSEQNVNNIIETWTYRFPELKCIVLQEGMSLEVMRPK